MVLEHSFAELVAKQFYNQLYCATNNYLQEYGEDIDICLYRVKTIDTLTLSDINIKFVDVSDLPGMDIEFDVVLEAEIEAHERDYHYKVGDKILFNESERFSVLYNNLKEQIVEIIKEKTKLILLSMLML